MEGDDLAWVRARTQNALRLYDRFRLDHVVGYFRQWVRSRPGEHGEKTKGRFDPEGHDAQRARGLRVLGAVVDEAHAARTNGVARVIAEDLGVVPDFVRSTLRELGMPGYRVIPWEKDGDRFRDPAHFPASSVATFSTHDTAPITAWWDDFADGERAELGSLAHVGPHAGEDERTHALLRMLFRSASDLTLVLAQELLGERARINLPGTVGEENWTYRLPKTIEELEEDANVRARLDAVKKLVEDAGRQPRP
jgi:4-alpha-glucanotransferase